MKFIFIFLLLFPLTSFAVDLDQWTEYKPGGETRCAHGGEFSFFVHEGDPSKVVIDFFGGGACWNRKTCKKRSIFYIDSIKTFMKHSKGNITGIYDKKDAKNPLLDWTHIVIPTCTGDIHMGENDQVYGKGRRKFTINHRGAINTKTVLKFVQEKFQNPEKVLVAGCSAGAYGSIYWLPHVKELYPASKIYQFADSGAGVITDDFFRKHANPKWKVWYNLPSWIPEIELNGPKNLIDLYSLFGEYYPDVSMSQFNYLKDKDQRLFYLLMGGEKKEWSNQIVENVNSIGSTLDNFHYYLSDGKEHCVLLYPRFYETKIDGMWLGDWLKELVGDFHLENKMCEDCL